MRLFGSENIRGIMDRLGVEEDEPIEHGLVTKAIENAQSKVEARNFDIRKRVLDYDDVMNQQREVIYAQRKRVLEEQNLKDSIMEMATAQLDALLDAQALDKIDAEERDYKALARGHEEIFGMPPGINEDEFREFGVQAIREQLLQHLLEEYESKEAEAGPETLRELERVVVLRTVDSKWVEHLAAMDGLREGIGLRAYGQRDPLIEYKFEAYEMFQRMIDSIQEEVVRFLFRARIVVDPPERQQVARTTSTGRQPVQLGAPLQAPVAATSSSQAQAPRNEPVRVGEKVGRNDPCPCGSGKKYKRCCG